MTATRCTWCGEYLTPEQYARGDRYCSADHEVTSLERRLAIPSLSPLDRPHPQDVPLALSVRQGYDVSAPGAASTARERAHQPSLGEDHMR